MYAFSLFSITNKVCIVISRHKTTTVQIKTANIGKIIKKLNTENKSLFGGLLETRREKRKRQLKNVPNKQLPNEGLMSSEIYWISGKRERNHKSAPRKIPNYERSKSNFKQSSMDNVRKPSFQKNPTEVNQSALKNNVASNNSNLEETVKRMDALELPAIIIRHIPTFPLQNKKGKLESPDEHKDLQFPSQDCTFPSVTKILSATLSDNSRAALNRWQQKMILELGEEGFQAYQRDLLDKGSQFHSAVHSYLSGTLESDLNLNGVEGCWHSLDNIIREVTDVRFLESHVNHSHLFYKGVIDCVASYKGKPVVIEWKRCTKPKEDIAKTYDAPLQLTAYVGAMNYDARYDAVVKGGLIVAVYCDGSPAQAFKMTMTDCEKYWKLWLHRLQKYWVQKHEEVDAKV